jgi:hypothetical protein
MLVGVTDIETDTEVIECKHTSNSNIAAEKRQVAIYGAMTNLTPVLYRTLEGSVLELEPIDMKYVSDLARATLALKQAQTKRRNIAPLKSTTTWSKYLVAVDIETHLVTQEILEIGAVVFDAFSGKVLDVFHVLDRSVCAMTKESDYVSGRDNAAYGFASIDVEQINQCKTKAAFSAWIDTWKGATRLNYSGKDQTLLGDLDGEWIDISEVFKSWMTQNGCERTGHTTLGNAVQQLMGEMGLFVPHRAFEDAVALSIVAYILFPRTIN